MSSVAYDDEQSGGERDSDSRAKREVVSCSFGRFLAKCLSDK